MLRASASLARASRRSTAREWPSVSGRDLAVRGIVIVSGLARGVDAIAHPPVGADLVNLMQPGTGQANLLLAAFLTPNEKKLYDLLNSDEPQPIDDIVERSGLNSSEILATLFNSEMKGILRQLPGKLFSKVLL